MTQHKAQKFQNDFFTRYPLAESIINLFDALPQIYFYAKDRNSRFVRVNHMFLENHNLSHELDAIGKSDQDFHPPVMAQAYMEEDRRVMESGKPLPGQTWLVLHRRQTPRWYVSTKTPLHDPTGEVIGIAGAMYRIEQPEELASHFQELLPVVNYIDAHFAEAISMAEMAELANLSSTHFNRRFRELLRMTPMQYLKNVRIQAAQRLLTTTSRELSEIAIEIGFTDQSHFTKRFREATGITPKEFRLRFMK